MNNPLESSKTAENPDQESVGIDPDSNNTQP